MTVLLSDISHNNIWPDLKIQWYRMIMPSFVDRPC